MLEDDQLEALLQKQHCSLTIQQDITREEWLACGQLIGEDTKRVHWWIGDWLNFGKAKWGLTPRYQEAAKLTGFDYSTLGHSAQVAAAIEVCRRRQTLSYSHHVEVACFPPEQQEWLLDQAEAKKWTIAQLRREKKKLREMSGRTRDNAEGTDLQPQTCQLYHCSVAQLSAYVKPGSLDAIITDPPYPRQYLEVYDDLTNFALHGLKDGGSMIVMVGQSYMPEVLLSLIKPPLCYHWLCCYYVPGDTSKQWPRQVGISWKPLIWLVKGKYRGSWVKDVVCVMDFFVGHRKDKQFHQWGQPENIMASIVQHFTDSGQRVCDPFLGGGTSAVVSLQLERSFIGADIDNACVETTKERVSHLLQERQNERAHAP